MNSIKLQNRMNAIFLNSTNSKISNPHRLLLYRSDKINLHLLYMEKIKKSYKNNKFKIPAPTWKEECEVPDGSYSVWDV